jgi:hypothetical protein
MDLYIDLLKKCLHDDIYGSDVMGCGPNVGKKATFWPSRAHSMIGKNA